MMDRFKWVPPTLALLGATMVAGAAHASIKEYQIARLLNFKTECQMDKLDDRSASSGPARFFATCMNVTFYPDGVELECPDRDDEWTCHILTKPTNFGALDLLRQKEDK